MKEARKVVSAQIMTNRITVVVVAILAIVLGTMAGCACSRTEPAPDEPQPTASDVGYPQGTLYEDTGGLVYKVIFAGDKPKIGKDGKVELAVVGTDGLAPVKNGAKSYKPTGSKLTVVESEKAEGAGQETKGSDTTTKPASVNPFGVQYAYAAETENEDASSNTTAGTITNGVVTVIGKDSNEDEGTETAIGFGEDDQIIIDDLPDLEEVVVPVKLVADGVNYTPIVDGGDTIVRFDVSGDDGTGTDPFLPAIAGVAVGIDGTWLDEQVSAINALRDSADYDGALARIKALVAKIGADRADVDATFANAVTKLAEAKAAVEQAQADAGANPGTDGGNTGTSNGGGTTPSTPTTGNDGGNGSGGNTTPTTPKPDNGNGGGGTKPSPEKPVTPEPDPDNGGGTTPPEEEEPEPEYVVFPNVLGLQVSEAIAVLNAAGFYDIAISEFAAATFPPGTVTHVYREWYDGTLVRKGSPVVLHVVVEAYQ